MGQNPYDFSKEDIEVAILLLIYESTYLKDIKTNIS
jgi:hypothetical protein